jgi:signal transduction histidine kinase
MKARPRSREPADPPQPRGELSLPTKWLRLSVEHSPTAIGIVRGTAFTLAYANVAFRDLSVLSGAPSGAVINRPLAEAFNPAAARSLLTLLDRARHEGIPTRARLTGDLIGVSGAWQCVAWSASPSVDLPDQKDLSGPIVVEVDMSSYSDRDEAKHRDLTELLLLSAIREEARAIEADAARFSAEQAKVAQGRFLAEVAHEIRAPMQAIIAYAKLIELGLDGALTGEQHEAFAGIREGTRHVDALIGELLHYTTSVARATGFSLTNVEVETTLRAAESLVAPQARAKGIAVEIAPGRSGAAVSANTAKLLQVVLNLLANAVKFTPPGGTITISWEVVAAPDGPSERIAIRVADTGRGIAANELPVVFDPYVQVGERGSYGDTGVGLGLAISRELARGMHGELVATSAPGVGSVFTLTLPSA